MAQSTPAAARPAATAASRSLSFTLSSLKPRMRVAPEAKAAATARIGYSSIIEGARAAGTSTPRSVPWRTRKSATSSPPSRRRSSASIWAPISPSVLRSPVLSGFIITPSTTMSEPGTISAATIGNAADEGSAGTTTVVGRNSGRPTRVTRRPSPSGATVTSAPKCASIFSVWSREACASITVVAPGALRPARRTADLICAEATGVRYSIGAGSRAPLSTIGQRPPSASDRIWAPISLSGSRMRRIGRLRKLASPSKVAVIPWPPTTPIISRAPVPALPKSRVSRGGRIAPSPGPRIRHWPRPRRSMTAPSASHALPVPSTSSPSSSPSTFVSPQARSPNRKARWEIDLSPGGRTRPLSGRARTALRGDAGRECNE